MKRFTFEDSLGEGNNGNQENGNNAQPWVENNGIITSDHYSL